MARLHIEATKSQSLVVLVLAKKAMNQACPASLKILAVSKETEKRDYLEPLEAMFLVHHLQAHERK